MKFCAGALKKMAEIMVEERNKIGANGLGIHEVETRLCELVREVGVQVLGNIGNSRMNHCGSEEWIVNVERRCPISASVQPRL